LLVWVSCIAGCAPAGTWPVSDHFDGVRFHNPKRVDGPNALQLARHIMFGRNGAWPEERLPVEPDLRLDAELAEDEVAVTFVNHATVLIQGFGLTILTDPVWSERVGPFSWAGPPRARTPGVPLEDLPLVDLVLISHNHYDHLDLPTLQALQARDAPEVIVPLGDRGWLMEEGITKVTELDWWEAVEFGDLQVVFAPAQHNSGRRVIDGNASLWGSYVIRRQGKTLYFAGDTAYESHFREVRERFGPVNLAFLPIGAYAPRESMRRFHMDPADAVLAHRDLQSRTSVAVHYGTFQLTNEDFNQPLIDLKSALQAADDLPGPFVALPEGRTWVVSLRAR